MKKEHRGMTFNEILFHENIDREYKSFINNNCLDKAIQLLVDIGFDPVEAKEQVLENKHNGNFLFNFFQAIFHSLTNYRFQK